MNVILSHKECTIIIAALKAWRDPIGFMSNGAGKELFAKYGELNSNELDFLIRRMKSAWNAPAGTRLTF